MCSGKTKNISSNKIEFKNGSKIEFIIPDNRRPTGKTAKCLLIDTIER
jgi:hypothetical protein